MWRFPENLLGADHFLHLAGSPHTGGKAARHDWNRCTGTDRTYPIHHGSARRGPRPDRPSREMVGRAADRAVQIHGGLDMCDRYRYSGSNRDARLCHPYEGYQRGAENDQRQANSQGNATSGH